MRHLVLKCVALSALLPGWCTASAADDLLQEKFAIGAGIYSMKSDTVVRADSIQSSQVGTTFNVEDVFGFDSEKLFRAEATWRFKPKHKLSLMYFGSDRRATRVIDSEIAFGDELFPVSSSITTDFKFDIIELAYEYQFLRGDNHEIGASVGLHNIKFGLALDAEVSGSGPIAEESIRESVKADAPLPVVGLRGMFRIAPRVYVQTHAQYFRLDISGIEGDVLDYQAGVLWQATRHLGIGAGYNHFVIDVDIDEGADFQGRMKWKYSGPLLFLRASF